MRARTLLALVIGLTLLGPPATALAADLYPDLKTLSPRNLRFDRADVSQDSSGVMHNVLRFSNTVVNEGESAVEIRAVVNPNLNPPAGPAYQRVFNSDGGFRDVPLTGSTLYYHAVHVHYHFDHWGEYQLWTRAEYDRWIASGRTAGAPDIVGQKTTSCVMDEEFAKSVASAVWPERYPAGRCLPDASSTIAQGLSPGWGDTYDYYRFEQWIDLDQGRLADGTYVLRSVSDPYNLVYESPSKADAARESQVDNEAVTVFTVARGAIVDSDAPTGTVTINHVDKATSSPLVQLDVLGRDDVGGVTELRVTNDAGATWKSFANTSRDSNYQRLSWDLTDPAYGGSTRAGTRTVCVLFKDATGKWGPVQTDTIDYQPPTPSTSAYARAVQGNGPAGWWRLGEASGTTAVDQTTGSAGTYRGGVTLGRASLIGTEAGNTAVAFDGASGAVTVPDSAALDLTNAITLEAWIRPTDLPAAGAFRSVLTKPEAYALQFNGPRLEFTVMQNGTRRRLQAPVGAIQAGSTYHVVGTYDGTTGRLYVNGAQVATGTAAGQASVNARPLTIGSWDGTMEYFKGTIDEPAVYAKVLTAAQVRAHHDAATSATLDAPSDLSAAPGSSTEIALRWTDNASGETSQVVERSADSSFTSVTTATVAAGAQSFTDRGLNPSTTYWYRVKAVSGSASSPYSNAVQATTAAPTSYAAVIDGEHPVSWWRLGDTSGTIAGDETVTGPGTFVGDPFLGVPSLLASDDANLAVGFNGATSTVRVGQTGAYDLTGALSLEAWVKPTTLPSGGAVRTVLAKPGSYALQQSGSAAAFTIVAAGIRRTIVSPAGALAAGRTAHLVGTYDGATQRLYVDGVLVASQALTNGADVTLGGLHIGSWDGRQEFFAGTIDEPAIYGRALDAGQVATHFGAAKAPLGAPSDLFATAVSPTRVDLQWTDNATTETAFVVQRSASSSFASPTTLTVGANVQGAADSRLAPSTTYWYRVRAVTASDSSPWSDAVSVATPAPVPYATVVTADAPVSWWRLGEASGTAAADERGANPGTYVNAPRLGSAGLLATAPANAAVAFGGGRTTVRVAQARSLDLTTAFSLEAWIRPTALPAAGAFASVLTKPESYSLQFNGPRLELTVIQNGTRRRLQAPAGAVAANTTYHVVGTYDGLTQRLYLNGVQVASTPLSGGASVSTGGLYVGSWDGTDEFFSGTIDEPAVYGGVLSPAKVLRHYEAGTVG